jgi:DNA-binding response OmpR family regulator
MVDRSLLLIIESDVDFCRMLRMYFQEQGYEVIIAQTGKDALQMSHLREPDITILNARLLGESGYDVYRNLQGSTSTIHVPVLFLTQADERRDVLRGLGLGADDYITIDESFSIEELGLRVRNKLPRTRGRPPRETLPAGGRLLVVEDEADIAEMLRIYFQAWGYEVGVAGRGEEAVEMCRRLLPHVVILDIVLPDIDGYEVCRRLRQDIRTSHTPIIFLTQRDERSAKIRGLELGADDYVTKPFDVQELRFRVKNSTVRAQMENQTDPTTGLPSGRLVEDHLLDICLHHKGWAILYVGVRGLYDFRERYGNVAGGEVLRLAAALLGRVVDRLGAPDDFVGHVGGSDFVVATSRDTVDPAVLARELEDRFAEQVGFEYDRLTGKQGYLSVDGEAGNQMRVDLMSLSIGVLTEDDGPFNNIREISEAAARARRRFN